MKAEHLHHENYTLSCRFLAEKAWNEKDFHVRSLILEDLGTKQKALAEESSGQIGSLARKSLDVAVFTITDTELPASKLAFGIDQTMPEIDNIKGIRIWNTIVNQPNLKTTLNVALVFLGEQTNLSSAVECSSVFSKYNVGLAILVGVAAGVKTKVSLLDVVSGVDVIYYEHQALKETGPFRRPIPFDSTPEMKRNLSSFIFLPKEWDERIKVNKLKWKDVYQEKWLESKQSPNLHKAVILSGEKLIKNGKLVEFANDYHERAYAAEEESGGFCKSCKEYGVPWIVFRGISDFGDPQKKKKYQPQAALNAATSAAYFLSIEYRKPVKIINF